MKESHDARAIFERSPLAIASLEGPEHVVRYANPAFCRLVDKPAAEVVGKPFPDLLANEEECVRLLDRVYRTGKPETYIEPQRSQRRREFRTYSMWRVLADDRPAAILIQVTSTVRLRDMTLDINEALLIGALRQHELNEVADSANALLQMEIMERTQMEAALRRSEERFRALFELGPVAVYSCDAAGVIVDFNRRAAEVWGRVPAPGETDAHFYAAFKVFRADGTAMSYEQSPMAAALSGAALEARDVELRIERPDGVWLTILANIRPLKDDRGHVTGTINCFYDITARKDAERRQHFLMQELVHRGKNMLAVVQTITSRTLSGTQSLAEAHEALTQRIHALARSQSVLVIRGFEGAPIAEIIRLECEGFSSRVTASGPDLMLEPTLAQTFALVVHELATNATKHGALSRPSGAVSIQWSVEGAGAGARFTFRWEERGGPPVTAPTRAGFGRTLLEKLVVEEFRATPRTTFAPEGLIYEIDAPLSGIAIT